MERTLTGTAASGPTGSPPPLPDVRGLLDGVPRQRTPGPDPVSPSGPGPQGPRPRPWHLLPTPASTPFTFFYAVVLALTSYVTAHADTALVRVLHENSSTDVTHLLSAPVPVLAASALWVAGGIASPFVLGFLLVLTALERRVGGVRAAGVFLLGHVLATLATEIPVGLAVLVGHLPDSSLHRLDYGISFGVAASVGALAGLLTPWLRRALLAVFGGLLLQDLLALTDPLSNWGHLMALAIGVGTWPWVRRWAAAEAAGPSS
ncbi:rhomboid-like protein [Streptomyces bobili]|uniref:rhomboid-like protein n=1 Tax=Streptomyces bobili TaxID=67280 RepID=UPI0033EFC851